MTVRVGINGFGRIGRNCFRAAKASGADVDFVAVHVEAPDESGHNGDAKAKISALEQIDEHIVGPVLDKLRSFPAWRIMVLPDHPTPVAKRTHTSTPPPFCMAGTGINPDRTTCFTEAEAEETETGEVTHAVQPIRRRAETRLLRARIAQASTRPGDRH